MLERIRTFLFPELRGLSSEARTAVMSEAVLGAMSDPRVHLAGVVCSLCAAAGAILGSGLHRGLVLDYPARFFTGLFFGAMLGGMAGGVIYAVALLTRARPRLRAALERTRAPRP